MKIHIQFKIRPPENLHYINYNPSMHLYFIRHGLSQNNALWLDTGSEDGRNMDPELTERGKRQVDYLVKFIKTADKSNAPYHWDSQNRGGFHFTHLYTSLMVRAVATAAIIARELSLPLVAWPDWHEGGGIYLEDEMSGNKVGFAGKNSDYFSTHYPGLQLAPGMAEDGWWNRPFEEHDQRWLRAERVRDELFQRHGGTDDRVVVVSHGGFFNYFLHTLLCSANINQMWFHLNNCSITRFNFDGNSMSLSYLNRNDFLPSNLVT